MFIKHGDGKILTVIKPKDIDLEEDLQKEAEKKKKVKSDKKSEN